MVLMAKNHACSKLVLRAKLKAQNTCVRTQFPSFVTLMAQRPYVEGDIQYTLKKDNSTFVFSSSPFSRQVKTHNKPLIEQNTSSNSEPPPGGVACIFFKTKIRKLMFIRST